MKRVTRNVILCVPLVLLVWEAFAPSYPRSKLPTTATEIQDYDTSGFIALQVDYFYLLTAKIDEPEFQEFITDIGFAKSELDVDWLPRMNGFDWWTPSDSGATVYASTSRWKPNAFAKYESGKLYYKESSGY